jgi:PhnB protein
MVIPSVLPAGELHRKPRGAGMSQSSAYVRHGFGTVRPYVHGHLSLWPLVQAFGATEIERHEFSPSSFHIEARIGDSVMVLELGDPPSSEATVGSIYVYVPDCDAAYQRAMQLGAISIATPEDKPYLERSAGVRDSFGNIWWLSTYHGQAGS